MATCRDIVTRALRMTSVVGKGEVPEAEELEDGMTVLQSMYDTWIVAGMFGRLKDVYEDGDYDAEAGQRVYVNDGVATLPDYTDTDCRWRDLAAIEIYDNTGRRAFVWDRVAWVRTDNLEPGTEAPLSARGENGLAACLALYYAEEFGASLGPGGAMQARNFKLALSLKMGSTQNVQPGVYF